MGALLSPEHGGPDEEWWSARPARDFVCTVVGVTFNNRYQRLKDVNAGDRLRLVREPLNEVDRSAIMVCDHDFQQLGYLPRSVSRWLASIMDAGHPLEASVQKVKGGDVPYYERLIIRVRVGEGPLFPDLSKAQTGRP